MKTLNEDPPKLGKGPTWDENLAEFIDLCLVKDPNQRKSADELLKCCQNLFKKAKGKEYIKEKLLKNIPRLEDRLDSHTKQLAMEQMKEDQNKKSNILNFDFSCQKGKDKEKENNDRIKEEFLFNTPHLKKAASNTIPFVMNQEKIEPMKIESMYPNGRTSLPAKGTFNTDMYSSKSSIPMNTTASDVMNNIRGKDLRTCAQQTTLDKISRSNGDTMNDDFSVTNEEES